MNEQNIPYPFKDCILFASEEKHGTCYLACHNRIYVERARKIELFVLPVRADKAFLISPDDLLLVIDSSRYNLSKEHFSYKILILNLASMEILHSKEYVDFDLRGIKIKQSDEVVVAFNKYDLDSRNGVDVDELYSDPPLPSVAICSVVQTLDLKLGVKVERVFEETLPDDLIINLSSLNDQEEVIDFNSSTRLTKINRDIGRVSDLERLWYKKIILMINDEFYLMDENEISLLHAKTGLVKNVYRFEEAILGYRARSINGFPEIVLFFKSYKKKLSISNSIKFLMDD